MAKRRRPNGSPSVPVRSVRVSDSAWEAARRRAAYEEVTISYVVATIIEGYGKGLIDLPKVTVLYRTSPTEEAS